MTFTVNMNNGVPSISSDSPVFQNATISNSETSEYIEIEITIENEKIPTYTLQINKVDEYNTDKKIANTRFLLKNVQTDKSIYARTNSDGTITIENMYQYVDGKNITGEYILQEVEASDGYLDNNEEIKFVVSKGNNSSEEGNETTEDSQTSDDSGTQSGETTEGEQTEENNEDKLQITVENEESLLNFDGAQIEGNTVILTVTNKPLFKVKKVDSETGEPLSNVDFAIYELESDGTVKGFAKDNNGQYVGTQNEIGDWIVTTNSDGEITAPLRSGNYKIVEYTFRPGYVEEEKVEYFTIQGNKVDEDDEDLGNPTKEDYKSLITRNITVNYIEDLVDLQIASDNGDTFDYTLVDLARNLNFEDPNSYRNAQDTSYGDINGNGEVETILEELTNRNGTGFTPIGDTNSFNGIFNGNNYEIQNIYINRSNENYAGLFGVLGNDSNAVGGRIINTGLTGTIITNNVDYVGSIAGYSNYVYTYVVGCYNKANITATDAIRVAGIGSVSFINKCYNMGNIVAHSDRSETMYVSGIGNKMVNSYTGSNNCYNKGNITVSGTANKNAYGISYNGVANCYNTGNVIVTASGEEEANVYAIASSSSNSYYLEDITIEGNIGAEEEHKTSEEMKQADFATTLGSLNWKVDTNNVNDGYPILRSAYIFKINSIEDLVELSNSVSGNYYKYDGLTVTLERTLDFNDDNSYENPNDESYGDLNGDGTVTGIKDELTDENGTGFKPIGWGYYYFRGTFDGKGNEVNNLYINRTDYNASFFGTLDYAYIKDLTLSGTVKSTVGQVGGFCGYTSSSITSSSTVVFENCINKCNVTGKGYAGGICGEAYNTTIFDNCENYGNIQGTDNYTGGIVGYDGATTVYNGCKNYGDITGPWDVGGLVGETNNRTYFIKSFNYGTIYCSGNYQGGIAGISIGHCIMLRCGNEGNIILPADSDYKGGLIGQASDGLTIKKCYNSGDIIGTECTRAECIAGFVGYTYGRYMTTTISDSWNSGNITITSTDGVTVEEVGGIVGRYGGDYNGHTCNIYSCFNSGNITISNPANYYAEIAGIAVEATLVKDSYNTGKITVTNAGKTGVYAAGIGFRVSNIENCINKGEINVEGTPNTYYVGGISSGNSIINNVYNEADINLTITGGGLNSYLYAGGIVGYDGQSISNAYNKGNITVIANRNTETLMYAGGIGGSTGGNISNVQNIGKIRVEINGSQKSWIYGGGLVGSNSKSLTNSINNGDFELTANSGEYCYPYIGGLTGTSTISLANSVNKGDIDININGVQYSYPKSGGIVGTLDSVEMTDVCNEGNITVNVPNTYEYTGYIGGIAGNEQYSSYADNISNVTNKGNVKTTVSVSGGTTFNNYVAGIIGYVYKGTLNNANNTGTIESTVSATPTANTVVGIGGILGEGEISVSQATNSGEIINKINAGGTIASYSGGAIGRARATTTENCYNTGNVTNTIEPLQPNTTIKYYNIYTGGVIGYADGDVNYSYNTGKLTNNITPIVATTDGCYVYTGGVNGYVKENTSHCYNKGEIENNISSNGAPNRDSSLYLGGVNGYGKANIVYNEGNINNTLNTIEQISSYVGGVTGSGLVTNAYNKGNIQNNITDTTRYYAKYSYTGGITGSGSCSNTYNVGELTTSYTNLPSTAYIVEGFNSVYNGANNYYLETLAVPEHLVETNSIAASESFMKNGEMYEVLHSVEEEWTELENDYPVFNMDMTEVEVPEVNVDAYEYEEYNKAITEINIENTKKTFDITTEIKPNTLGLRIGGTITGEYTSEYPESMGIKLVETRKFTENSTVDIVATPEEGYQITSITINGSEYEFDKTQATSVTIPAGYFENIDMNYYVVVTFSPMDEVLEINKEDKNGNSLEGAEFSVEQVENRAEPDNSYFGEMTGTGPDYEIIDPTQQPEDIIDNMQQGSWNASSGYYFERQSNGTYRSNNYHRNRTTAGSYMEVDLTDREGTYTIVVNASVSSEKSDSGMAYLTTTDPVHNYLQYSDHFIDISGTENIRKDYKTPVLNGGTKYYLCFEYKKDYSTHSGNDRFYIYSVKLYKNHTQSYGFVANGEKYESNNTGNENTKANSSMSLDLRNYRGKYKVTVNAEQSGKNNVDYGKINVTAPGYAGNEVCSLNGTVEAADYSVILDGGRLYSLDFEYSRGAGTDSDHGSDKMTINSIKIELDDSDFVKETGLVTDENGKITAALGYGKYIITETKAPEGYELDSTPIVHTIASGTNNTITIENEKNCVVTSHYYLEETGPEYGNEPVVLSADETVFGKAGTNYKTRVIFKIDEDYTLKKVNNKYQLPENATGIFTDEPIDVYYYYELNDVNYKVHYLYDNIEDESLQEINTAKPGDVITTYQDKVKPGYKLYEVQNIPLTVSSDKSENDIYVMYLRDSFDYTVHYFYDGVEDESKKDTLVAVFGNEVNNYEDKVIDGYEFEKVKALDENGEEKDLPLVITDNVENNRINVYYVRSNFDYEVHYFYDGDDDESKTEFLSAKYGDKISTYPDKNITGYKLEKEKALDENGDEIDLPLTIRTETRTNRINVYYVKDSFDYTVHYFYDGTEDTAKKETLRAVFGSEITEYTDKNITGYKLEKAKALNESGEEVDLPLVIKADANKNVINVYYVKDSFDYTVHYFYDGTEDTAKKETLRAVFGSEITEYTDKNITGYKLEKAKALNESGEEANLPLVIKADANKNVINVYYVKDSFDYTVHYFYDGTEDTAKKETLNAVFGSSITEVPDKNITGYKHDRTETLPLVISANVDDNVVNVYYVKDSFDYTVHYFYDGTEDTAKKETLRAVFGSEISEYTDKNITGYKLEKAKALNESGEEANLPLVIKADANKNVINVYYVKDSFDYTVHYFYDGTEDTAKKETLSAVFGSSITEVPDKNITGYKHDRTEGLPLTISAVPSENVVNVYYVKDNFNYTVHYFYDGTEDESKKETLSAVFGSEVTEVPDKNITGYKHDRTEGLPLTISENSNRNVVNVFYVKDNFNYTVHYFYDGTEDESKKETLNAVFGSEVTEVPDKNIPGYKKQKTEGLPLTISANEEENVVNVYYIPDELGYTVHYFYEGIEDETKVENNNATFGSIITEVPDKNIAGYKHERTEGLPLTISANEEENVVNVYYVRDIVKYTVHYFYENVEDEAKVEEGTALVGSEVSNYVDKVIPGYELDRAKALDENGIEKDLPLIVKADELNNIINVYYVRQNANVTVEYVDNLTGKSIIPSETIPGKVGDTYTVDRKDIPGYRLDVDNIPTNETGTISIGGNIVRYVYIELRPYELLVRYTVENGDNDEAKIGVTFGDTSIDEYTINGILKIADIELTDLGEETYTVYETETPENCKTVISKQKPAVVELIRRLNTEKGKYEFVANYEEIEGFKVVIDEENKKVIFDITTIKEEKYDLAIRKFISKIDNEEITDRVPQVLVSADNKITYVGNDNIEKAKNNQNITYTLRMYNESEVKAKGKRIVEYVPEGLVFVPDNEINRQYSWKMYKVGANGEAVEVSNAEEATILVTDYLDGKEIKEFNLDTKEVSYLDVQAVFKVDESRITREDRIVENKVQIAPNENDENTDNDVTTEKVYVQYFDLSIEKYIQRVTVNTNGTEVVREVGYEHKGELVKVDVKNSEAKNTKIEVTYGLLVKNVGEIPGYATEITEYIPEDFELKNIDEWTINGNTATSTVLSDKLLNPGESIMMEVTFEWDLAKGSIGTRRNEAEITKYANDFGAEDVTKDNKDGEDLLVTLKTGSEAVTTIAIAAAFTSILALGVLVIKRKVTAESKH